MRRILRHSRTAHDAAITNFVLVSTNNSLRLLIFPAPFYTQNKGLKAALKRAKEVVDSYVAAIAERDAELNSRSAKLRASEDRVRIRLTFYFGTLFIPDLLSPLSP